MDACSAGNQISAIPVGQQAHQHVFASIGQAHWLMISMLKKEKPGFFHASQAMTKPKVSRAGKSANAIRFALLVSETQSNNLIVKISESDLQFEYDNSTSKPTREHYPQTVQSWETSQRNWSCSPCEWKSNQQFNFWICNLNTMILIHEIVFLSSIIFFNPQESGKDCQCRTWAKHAISCHAAQLWARNWTWHGNMGQTQGFSVLF